MKRLGLFVFVLFVFPITVFGAFSNPIPNPADVIASLNRERIYRGLVPLSIDNRLMKAAEVKVADIASRKALTHSYAPAGTPWKILSDAGYSYRFAGENLAANVFTVDDLISGWMDSSTHRANILNQVFSNIGVAVLRGEYEGYDSDYVVAYFGTPKISDVAVAGAISTSNATNSEKIKAIRELIDLLTKYLMALQS